MNPAIVFKEGARQAKIFYLTASVIGFEIKR